MINHEDLRMRCEKKLIETYTLARALLNDAESQIFTDEVLLPFLNNAKRNHPQASERRLGAIVAMSAMESRSWHDGARGIRESIAMGLL